jgi:hypothetical protein
MSAWEFRYSAEQWDLIAGCIALMRGVDDAHLIPKGGGPSVRSRIEVAAGMYCVQGLLKRRAADRQARIDKLTALRDDLRDRPLLVTTTSEAFIRSLTTKIDLLTTVPLRMVRDEPRDEPAGNAAKTGRQKFWTELLAIWTEIGGKETGAETARFLIVASTPVFDFIRGDADASDKDRAIPDKRSVEQWLRRRRATR